MCTCKYCNENPHCNCRCHTLTMEDIQEAHITGCDPEVYD